MKLPAPVETVVKKKRRSRFIKSLATLAFSGCIAGWMSPSIYAQDFVQGQIFSPPVPQTIESTPFNAQLISPAVEYAPTLPDCNRCQPFGYPQPPAFSPVYGTVGSGFPQLPTNVYPEYKVGEVVIGQNGVISGNPVINGMPVGSLPIVQPSYPIYPSSPYPLYEAPAASYPTEFPIEGSLSIPGEVILSESPSLTSPSDQYQGVVSPFGDSEAAAKLREELERSEAEVADLQTVIAELKVDLKGANERVYATERKLKTTLTEVNTKMEVLADRVEKLTAEKAAMQEKLAAAEAEMALAAEDKSEKAKLSKELRQVKQQLEDLGQRHQSAIDELKAEQKSQLDTKLAGSEKKIVELKNQLRQAEEKMAQQAAAAEKSQQQAKVSQVEADKAKVEAAKAKEAAAAMTAKLREQLKSSQNKLKAELAAAEKRHAEMVREQAEKARQLAAMRALAEKERNQRMKGQKDSENSKGQRDSKMAPASDVQQRLNKLHEAAKAEKSDSKKPSKKPRKNPGKKKETPNNDPKPKQADAKKGKDSDADSPKKEKGNSRFNADEQIKKLENSRQRQIEKATRANQAKEKSLLKDLSKEGIGKDHPEAKKKLRELQDRLDQRIDEIKKRVDERIKRIREEARRRSVS